MRKRTNKIIIFLTIIFSVICINNIVKASEYVDKVYCNATINDNFSDETVSVILTNEESLKLKNYSVNDFVTENIANIGISRVIELTAESTELLRKQLNNCEEVSNTEEINTNKYRRIFSLYLTNKSKENVLNVIEELEDREEFRYVGVDYVEQNEIFSSNTSSSTYASSTLSTLYSDNLETCKIESAWNITTGSSSVRVGILDTGIDGSHNDLSPNLSVSLSRDFTQTNENGTLGVAVSSLQVSSGETHGTMVAGIIGANGTMKGVCKNVTMVSLKVFAYNTNNNADSTVMSSRLIAAISYAMSINIKVLNFSGGRIDGTYVEQEKQAIANFNGLFIESAGNEGVNLDNNPTNYPVCYDCDNMIIVGAIDQSKQKLDDATNQIRSCYGATIVDLFAPGIVSSTSTNNLYSSDMGTSFAAPYVTGTVALLYSLYPSMRASEIKNIILNNVETTSNLENYCNTNGYLNVYDAVAYNPISGSGTLSNPYIINSIHSFEAIKNHNTADTYFKQTANIDFENTSHDLHELDFKGHYDGNGNYLINISYSKQLPSGNVVGGVFGKNSGTIDNLKISRLTMNVTSNGGVNGSIGGVVGCNFKILEYISVYKSTITTNSQFYNTGGIAGDNCYSSTTSYSVFGCVLEESTINARGYTGGIIGYNEEGSIYGCSFADGNINYDQYGTYNKGVGGIIGLNKGKVYSSGCTPTGKIKYVSATTTQLIKPRIGKVIGENWSGEDNIINCYTTGTIDSGTLSASLNQLDYVGTYYNGKVGLEYI